MRSARRDSQAGGTRWLRYHLATTPISSKEACAQLFSIKKMRCLRATIRGRRTGPALLRSSKPATIEQLKIVDPLANPTAHGASAADAFDVVIPSMPGYGFSGKPTTTGWDPAHIARAWVVLMRRLGYTKFVAQGGDWGAIITDVIAPAQRKHRRCHPRCLR